MPLTTPFHSCLESLNSTRIWKNWAGYLVAPKYQYSIATEYYGIRNAVTLFDTSPLFKYEIQGQGARSFLRRLMARNIDDCQQGQAQYTVWCNSQGFTLQDGVVICINDGHFRLTAAEPALKYFRELVRNEGFEEVSISDVSRNFGILALQGPLAYEVLSQLSSDVTGIPYFGALETELNGIPVLVSRTGFTGDLGFELWIRSDDAVACWELLMQTGENFNLIPIGTTALKMARVEAGLLLMGADFDGARYAWVDAQRETPIELGWSWMFRNLSADDRDFVGRQALESELHEKTSRWRTVGLEIDWVDYQRVFRESGVSPPMHEIYSEQTMSLYRVGDKELDYAGYATSFLFSSLLKKPIAIAKLPLDMVAVGTELKIELEVIRKPVYVKARVARLPFLNLPRKTASLDT